METRPSARAFWVAHPGLGEIRDEPLPPPRAGEVLVRTEFTAISRGTESLVFNGHVPVSEYQRMRAPFQAGDFPGPVKYGYCNVGVVEAGEHEWRDRRVFALVPHQTHYVVPVMMVHAIPAEVPSGRAVLAANMETAVNGCWDADLTADERVTVIGAGTVGALVSWVARTTMGCDVELVDIDPDRAAIAQRLGVRFALADAATAERHVVIHTSGSEAGLRTALRLAANEGRIIEMSWFGDRQISLPLGEAFHSRRLTIRSSQVGAVSPSHRGGWDFRRRMGYALDLLAAPELDALITGESAFEDLPALMPRLAAGGGGTLCHRIRY